MLNVSIHMHRIRNWCESRRLLTDVSPFRLAVAERSIRTALLANKHYAVSLIAHKCGILSNICELLKPNDTMTLSVSSKRIRDCCSYTIIYFNTLKTWIMAMRGNEEFDPRKTVCGNPNAQSFYKRFCVTFLSGHAKSNSPDIFVSDMLNNFTHIQQHISSTLFTMCECVHAIKWNAQARVRHHFSDKQQMSHNARIGWTKHSGNYRWTEVDIRIVNCAGVSYRIGTLSYMFRAEELIRREKYIYIYIDISPMYCTTTMV